MALVTRYLVTGPQLGVIRDCLTKESDAIRVVDNIIFNQYLFSSKNKIEDDVETVEKLIRENKE